MEELTSPFGGKSRLIRKLDVSLLVSMYADKCGYDASRHFNGLDAIELYECDRTGMRFWRPTSIAGDGRFYASLSDLWPGYYQTDRWEYRRARSAIGIRPQHVVEVGCGAGYFLKTLEKAGHIACGLELNRLAIQKSVTTFPVHAEFVEAFAARNTGQYDVVCSFQVLEHLPDPHSYLMSCIALARPGGKIIVSTPNYQHVVHAQARDAFDLPPHHLNHFTADTFQRIAGAMGLELDFIEAEVLRKPKYSVWEGSQIDGLNAHLRKILNTMLFHVFGTSEVGHTIIAGYTNAECTTL